MHIVTLSFDDGFLHSNREIADIYESFGMKACFNIIALGDEPERCNMDDGRRGVEVAGFELWNELQARGHEIMPHSYQHHLLPNFSFAEGKALIESCFAVFQQKLSGFEQNRAVYNFAYNATTPELEEWLPTVVRAFRGGAIEHGINPLPSKQTTAIRTAGHGPDNCEADLDICVEDLLNRESGWLVYNTHGLDEGWGPISADYLKRLLERLAAIDSVRVMPAGAVLAEVDAEGQDS